MSRALERAEKRLEHADKLLKAGKALFALYVVVMVTVLMAQLYSVQSDQRQLLETLVKSNKEQHQLTQGYVKCIATSLLLPLAQRNQEAFDRCGIEAGVPATSAATEQSPVAPQASVGQAPSTPPPAASRPATEPTTPQPTTGGPPDPERPAEGNDPFEGDLLFNILDGIISPLRAL